MRLSGSSGSPSARRYRRTRVSTRAATATPTSSPAASQDPAERHLDPTTCGARLPPPFLLPAAAEPSLPQHLAHRLQHHLAAQSGLGALREDGPFGGQAALIPDHGPAERGAARHGSARRGLSPLTPAAPPAPPAPANGRLLRPTRPAPPPPAAASARRSAVTPQRQSYACREVVESATVEVFKEDLDFVV